MKNKPSPFITPDNIAVKLDVASFKRLTGVAYYISQYYKGLNQLKKLWTKILVVVDVGSLEKRSNQPKCKEPRTRSGKN